MKVTEDQLREIIQEQVSGKRTPKQIAKIRARAMTSYNNEPDYHSAIEKLGGKEEYIQRAMKHIMFEEDTGTRFLHPSATFRTVIMKMVLNLG
jgi:hypothetical protein